MSLRGKRILTWALAALWMAAIYWFSSQNVVQSAQTSQPFAEFLARLAGERLDALSPDERMVTLDHYQHIVRKCAHVGEYAILACLLFHVWRLYPMGAPLRALMTVLPCMLYAALDEAHQITVSGRGPGVGDVLIDSLGALLGAGACFLLSYCLRRYRAKQKGA